jgi:hypothetical protein
MCCVCVCWREKREGERKTTQWKRVRWIRIPYLPVDTLSETKRQEGIGTKMKADKNRSKMYKSYIVLCYYPDCLVARLQ